MANQLTALCATASFLWLAHNLEHHQLIEQPRLSSLLVLLIAAFSSYAASFCAAWLPGANGRFDDELAPLKAAKTNLPKKPRRYYLPGLVFCIILRLEVFHRVSSDLQCSRPGIEAFLPLLILAYELLPGRRARLGSGLDEDDDHDDMGMTVLDAFGAWLHERRASLWIGVSMLVWGTYLASSQDPRSTFFCLAEDRSRLVVFFQWVGLFLDAAIAVALWRVLAWARTTKIRLRTLSGILLASALATGLLYWASRLVLPARPVSYHFRGLDSLYLFDVVADGLAFSAFLISAGLLATEGSLLSLVGIVGFASGFIPAVRGVELSGTWENVSPLTTYFALLLVCVGFSCFVYANEIRSVVFVHRAILVFLLVLLTIAATIYVPVKAFQVIDEHPLTRIIYDSRVAADRWLVHAAVSDSLPVAVREYRDRHNGRDPPLNFDVWYYFAKEHHSVIIDHFPQIDNDLLPFWGVAPSKIRDDVRRAAAEPDTALLQIQDGSAQHNIPPSSPYRLVVDDLVDLIKPFAAHLPDMELAVNLDERPRVLTPWDDRQRGVKAASRKRISKLLPRADGSLPEMPAAQPAATDKLAAQVNFTSVRALREMTALACPPGTSARAGTHWDIRDFCAPCARPQSQGQYLVDWRLSQDICHQSDLLRLHSFHMTPPALRPSQELLPVFSRAKTASYSDILIPLRRISEPPAEPGTERFGAKQKKLFWRGKVDRLRSGRDLVRGGHQERLVHSLNTRSRSDTTRLLLPARGNNKNRLVHEQVRTADLNALLPLDVTFSSYVACKSSAEAETGAGAGARDGRNGGCDAAAAGALRSESEQTTANERDDAAAASSQYLMLVDTDDGPPREFPRALRSASVPLLASVFREWYSDRVLPWIHFVPVDLRFHALHGTLAYFVGIRKQQPKKEGGESRAVLLLNGREVEMPGRTADARWIAEQGSRWAEKALRREDMQVYLFRLLLEWGRVIDDRRDEIGFALP